ncbi:MAG: HAMP domain-containing protein [Acidimicrobiia bacterium]|nr:HAMP domain-containing protein [Acidimicrobiia bacterium]
MKPLKLRTKIILFTSLLVIAVVAGSFLMINQVVKTQVRKRLVRDLERSQQTVEQIQKDRLREMVAYSIIASENSTLEAAIETYQTELKSNSPILEQLRRTVENETAKLFDILKRDLLVITSNSGEVLSMEGTHLPAVRSNLNLADQLSIRNCLSPTPNDYEQAAGIWRFQERTYRIVSVPILLQDIVIGTLSSGYEISQHLVETIKLNTDSDVVFVAGGQAIASTIDHPRNQILLRALKTLPQIAAPQSESQTEVILEGETFLALQIGEGSASGGGFVILNSIDRAMRNIMGGIKVTLVFIGLFSIVIAMLLGLALSQSITQPLMNFVNFMGEITRSGKLQRKFQPQRPNYEVDVLARSFESMAQSLAESQAESSRYHEELRRKELNEEKLSRLATRSRLDALISQINPHFLFNALNTVGVLIDENPEEARRLTVKLASIFRQTLQASEREVVSVQEELRFVQDYLEIEKARFGERLQVEERIEVNNAQIPCFTLQPLIENAIKHGAALKIGTTTIRIAVLQDNGHLQIQVSDDGMGMTESVRRNMLERGYGLRNLIDRLNIHYSSEFAWNVDSEFEKGTVVSLALPCHPSATSA